jgi:hypothetical protein
MPLKLRVFFESNISDELTQNYINKIQKFNENQIEMLVEKQKSELETNEKTEAEIRNLKRAEEHLMARNQAMKELATRSETAKR